MIDTETTMLIITGAEAVAALIAVGIAVYYWRGRNHWRGEAKNAGKLRAHRDDWRDRCMNADGELRQMKLRLADGDLTKEERSAFAKRMRKIQIEAKKAA